MLVQFFEIIGFKITDPETFLFHGTLLFAPLVYGVLIWYTLASVFGMPELTDRYVVWIVRVMKFLTVLGHLFFGSCVGLIP